MQHWTPDIGVLQNLADKAKVDAKISSAHIAVLTELEDAFAEPSVRR